MKKIIIFLFVMMAFITGGNQSASVSTEDITKIAYQWEKANFDRDYDREQELIYKKGSHEVHKTTKRKNSGLKYEDIRYEVYYDEDLEQYYVFTDFKNPNGENSVKDNIVIRKKGEEWKIDADESLNVVRENITTKFESEACINCK